VAERLDDLQVYSLLHRIVEDLDGIAGRCHSVAAATAIRATTRLIKALASGLYKNGLSACGHVENIAENCEKV
jgi:hypothetical protein